VIAEALALLLPFAALAADAPKKEPARMAGTITKADARLSPSSDGPVFKHGRVTIVDKAEKTEELKAVPRTKVTLDGKPAKFQKAAAAGMIVLKALYDPATKELASLDLKSPPSRPKAENEAEAVRGEIAGTDIVRNVLTLRVDRQKVMDFIVADGTTIKREIPGKLPEPVALESLQVGDAVELYTADGRTALTILARAPR